MTREEIEQINEIEPYSFETSGEEQWYRIGLLEGLETADANPKSSWISVNDDLPCNHKALLLDEHRTKTVLVVLSRNDNSSSRHIDRLIMINKKGSSDVDWYWFNNTHYTVTHWMPVPELPK